MRKLFTILLIIALLLAGVAVAEDDNRIDNGDFSDYSGGYPQGWRQEMWYTEAGVSTLKVEELDGDPCIYVMNNSDNDARYACTVPVKPDTMYRITCRCKTDGEIVNGIGATISVKDTFTYSNEVTDTSGEWQTLELYGTTGQDQEELVLFARVGGYGALSTGGAWFDDFEMTEIDEAPTGVEVQKFYAVKASSDTVVDTVKDDEAPTRNTEAYLLLTALYLLAVVAVVRKRGRLSRKGLKGAYGMIMAAALLTRLFFAAKVPGYNTDINCFTAWAYRMYQHGPAGFYTNGWCDYPPLYMLMLWPIGALMSILRNQTIIRVLLKLWPILFDLLGAAAIYRITRKHASERAALLVCAFYALNPAVLIDSAAWGQVDGIFTLLIMVSAVTVSERRYLPAMLSISAAILTKPQALLFAPLGLWFCILSVVRSKNWKRGLRRFCVACAVALGAIYLFALPFAWVNGDGIVGKLVSPVIWLFELYGATMSGYAYVVVNALNVYTLLGLNWAAIERHEVVMNVAWLMFALSYCYCGVLALLSKKRKTLPFLGGVLIVLLTLFGPMIHERYVFPAVMLLAVGYALLKDKRILISAVILTGTLMMNEILVLQGGMTAYNGGHLQSSEQLINNVIAVIAVVNGLFLAWTAFDICVLNHVYALEIAETPEVDESLWIGPSDHKLHLMKKDWLIMAAITVVYSVVAFTNLGTLKAPETSWVSSGVGDTVVFDLNEVSKYRMTYYGGICNSNFMVELSNDGEEWTAPVYATYKQGEIFRWLWFVPRDINDTSIVDDTIPTTDGSPYVAYSGWENETYPYQTSRYIRITSMAAGLTLNEFGFLDTEGMPLPVSATEPALVDEQDTIQDHPSYLNSSYFDEIYHARTAYEHLHGMSTYEWTHPPLGKVTMMIGVAIFGMTPFGWRFMGALFGVLMLPLIYLMVMQLTKKTRLATIAALLLSLDSMHFTQTRIATIDSYAVFWIMLMYFFMFRFMQMAWTDRKSFVRSLVVLGLCGVTMGIAWATKWIGLYASVGLAVLFFISLYRRLRGYFIIRGKGENNGFVGRAVITILFCLLFFITVPVLIYYFSHYWHLRSYGVTCFADMFKRQHVKEVIDLQVRMFNYHNGLSGDTHFFRSPWYQWPLIVKPMWYYSGTGYLQSGMVSSISCMGNPAVWWFGLLALTYVLVWTAVEQRAKRVYAYLLISFASQFLPWVLVPRSTFIYHYFASVPFIIVASVLLLERIRELSKTAYRITTGVLLGASLGLFAMFYPLESGLPAPRSYVRMLRWFNWYNY